MLKKLILALAVVTPLLAGLGGCNTIRGMGEDIQKAGQTIEDAAKKK